MRQLESQGIEEYYLEPAVFMDDSTEGVAEAHAGIIRRNIDEEQLTIFEDDIVFTSPNSWKKYWEWGEELPDNWLIYSGGQYRSARFGTKCKQKFSENLYYARWHFGGAHWYTIKKGCYQSLLNRRPKHHWDVHMGKTGIPIYCPMLLPSRQMDWHFEGAKAVSERNHNRRAAHHNTMKKFHKYYTK
jgi:hypothetical protein